MLFWIRTLGSPPGRGRSLSPKYAAPKATAASCCGQLSSRSGRAFSKSWRMSGMREEPPISGAVRAGHPWATASSSNDLAIRAACSACPRTSSSNVVRSIRHRNRYPSHRWTLRSHLCRSESIPSDACRREEEMSLPPVGTMGRPDRSSRSGRNGCRGAGRSRRRLRGEFAAGVPAGITPLRYG